MHNRIAASLLAVVLAWVVTVNAQTPPPPSSATPTTTAADPTSQTSTSAPATPPQSPPDQGNTANPPAPPRNPAPLSTAAGSVYDRHDSLPYVNVYLPEGEASIRLRKLIKNVLFESQIDYRFVNGDISTFLRYKYYARNYTYKLTLFDSLGFPDLGKGNSQDFERTRGGLLLFELPRNYNDRYFWLLQDDRLTFGDVTRVDNRKNNIYTKVGYQFGTPFDERLNSIVGESRGRITPVLTAFREIGPQKTGLAVAITESLHFGTGSYRYTKVEGEVLRRFDITGTSFVISRLHVGLFPTRDTIRGSDFAQIDRYSIPRYEMFEIGGREAMKAIHSNSDDTGTHEIHETNEYFVPVFRNKDLRSGWVHWNTLYGIGYLGAGTVGFDYTGLFNSQHLAVDAGLGSEMALVVRDYNVLLSVVYAHTVKAPDALKGGKVLLSIRTIR
jgi:hypothetical protein